MDGQSLTVRSALSHLGWQGFIQSILMSSKLNLLTEFSNSIFMKLVLKHIGAELSAPQDLHFITFKNSIFVQKQTLVT